MSDTPDDAASSTIALGSRRQITRIAIAYALLAALWIVASDWVLGLYFTAGTPSSLSILKGLAFVAVTSLLLYGVLRYVSRGTLRSAAGVPGTAQPDDRLVPTHAYAIAGLLTLLTLALRENLPSDHALRAVMIVFLVPVTLGGLLGGLGPGLLATALATAGVLVSDLAAIDVNANPTETAAQLTRFGLFVVLGIGSSFVCESLHEARRRAEALLAARQRLHTEYRLLSEQLPDYVWRKNLEGLYVDCNSRFAAALGLNIAQVRGRAERELFFAEDAAHWRAEDAEIIQTGRTVDREQLWRTPQGDVGWVHVTKAPAVDDAGRCIGTIGVARDITARRATEEALRASESHLQALFVESIDAMATFVLPEDGPPGKFLDVNPAGEALLGVTRAEFLALTPADLLPGLDATALASLSARAREAGHLRVDLQVCRPDGERVPVDVSITIVHQRADASYLAMAIARDMRERRQAEGERLRLQAQVVEMQKHEAIGQLTGGIAHDFNNLLATVLGYSELARGRASAAADLRLAEYLDAIRIAGERGRDLVAKMLTFSRSRPLDAAQLPGPLDLKPVIGDTLRLLRATIPSSATIDFTCDEPLPPVQAERVEIEQVVMNLAINARDAMDGVGELRIAARGPRHIVDVCTACGQDVDATCVVLSVGDSGPGIAGPLRRQVFQPFYTNKPVGQGTGLGLAVVHGIVHKHGGHIVIGESAQGARFDVLLPLAADGAGAPLEAPLPGGATASGGGLHLLVVDDEQLLCEYWRSVLSEAGFRVSAHHDASAALAAFLADPAAYAAVISDQTMPGMTGDVLAREIHARRPDLPIVLCSGYSERLQRVDASALGVAALLEKPVSRERMLEVLAALVIADT